MPFRGGGAGVTSHDKTYHNNSIIPAADQSFQGKKLYELLRLSDIPTDPADLGTDGIALMEKSTTTTGTIGNTNIDALDTSAYGNIIATKYTMPLPATITKFNLYLSAITNARMAMYDHDGVNNRPGNLLKESSSEACAAGAWHVFDIVDFDVGAIDIWLAYQHDLNGNCIKYGAESGRQIYYKAQAYGAFPNPFGVGTATSNYRYSDYADYSVSTILRRLYANVNDTIIGFTPEV